MQTIIDYTILYEYDDIYKLGEEVKEYIEKGRQPKGQMQIVYRDGKSEIYIQVMVKYQ